MRDVSVSANTSMKLIAECVGRFCRLYLVPENRPFARFRTHKVNSEGPVLSGVVVLGLQQLLLDLVITTQDLCHAPRLRDTALRYERDRPIEDLACRAQAGGLKVVAHGAQDSHRRGRVMEHAQVRLDERTQQPRPYRALVVCRIATVLIARVDAEECAVARRE